MFDVALISAGAQIALATSHDEEHPPEHIIDGTTETFWCSTGLFPQEFVITFQSLMNINSIRIECSGVKKLQIERSVHNDPIDFEMINKAKDLEHANDNLQVEEIAANHVTARHLKFIIVSGYDHFVSVHKVHVDGSASHEQ